MTEKMTQSAENTTAVENACQDIDRYVAETAQPSSHDGPISPSQRCERWDGTKWARCNRRRPWD
jgi:hypothetical protein